MSKIVWPEYDQVYDLFIVKNLRRSEVAEICGITDRLLKKILSVYGIKKDRKKVYELGSETLMNTRGVSNPWALPEVIKNSHSTEVEARRLESNIKTCMERYGTTNGGGTPQALEKIRSTMQAKYDVDYYVLTDDCLNRSHTKEANKKRQDSLVKHNNETYGVDYW